MTGRVIVIVLLALIAVGTNTDSVPVERTDLPVRVRVVRKIGDGFRAIKTAVFWFAVGRFTEDPEPQGLFQGPLDEEWIDCELPSDGFIAPTEAELNEMYGDEFPAALVIPRGEWQQWITSNQAAGFSLTLYNDTLNFQAPEHSCVSNATETAIRIVRNVQLGLNHKIKCSPMSLYCRMNSRRWGGSTMIGNLNESAKNGILPEDTPENRLLFGEHVARQNTVYFPASDLPEGWEETAKHFRPLKFFLIRTKEQFASALLRGWPIVNGRSGHSICHVELVYRNGKYLSKYADSYGTSRGDGGYLYDSENMWSTGGAWCLVSVTCPDDPQFPAGKKTTLLRSVRNEDSKESDVVLHRSGTAFDHRKHEYKRGIHLASAA